MLAAANAPPHHPRNHLREQHLQTACIHFCQPLTLHAIRCALLRITKHGTAHHIAQCTAGRAHRRLLERITHSTWCMQGPQSPHATAIVRALAAKLASGKASRVIRLSSSACKSRCLAANNERGTFDHLTEHLAAKTHYQHPQFTCLP